MHNKISRRDKKKPHQGIVIDKQVKDLTQNGDKTKKTKETKA